MPIAGVFTNEIRIRPALGMGGDPDEAIINEIAAIQSTDPVRAEVLRRDLSARVYRREFQETEKQRSIASQGLESLVAEFADDEESKSILRRKFAGLGPKDFDAIRSSPEQQDTLRLIVAGHKASKAEQPPARAPRSSAANQQPAKVGMQQWMRDDVATLVKLGIPQKEAEIIVRETAQAKGW